LIATLTAALETARKKYSQLLIRLKLISPEYESFVNVNTLSLSEVQEQALDEESVLIEYFVMEEYTLAWVIDRAGFESPTIGYLARRFSRTGAISAQLDYRERVRLRCCRRSLQRSLCPLQPYVDGKSLLIVAHDILHYLPFSALWNAENERYLAEEVALSYTPSASSLNFIRAKRSDNSRRLLALGNPDGL